MGFFCPFHDNRTTGRFFFGFPSGKTSYYNKFGQESQTFFIQLSFHLVPKLQ